MPFHHPGMLGLAGLGHARLSDAQLTHYAEGGDTQIPGCRDMDRAGGRQTWPTRRRAPSADGF